MTDSDRFKVVTVERGAQPSETLSSRVEKQLSLYYSQGYTLLSMTPYEYLPHASGRAASRTACMLAFEKTA